MNSTECLSRFLATNENSCINRGTAGSALQCCQIKNPHDSTKVYNYCTSGPTSSFYLLFLEHLYSLQNIFKQKTKCNMKQWSHMYKLWQCSTLCVFQPWSSITAPPRVWGDWKTGLSHKMKWSLQLCATASSVGGRRGSPHSALLGVRHTLESHAGIIRDSTLLRNRKIAMNYTEAGG